MSDTVAHPQNKTFRTRFLVFWVLSNAGLAISIQNINGPNSDPADQVHIHYKPRDKTYADIFLQTKKSNTYFAVILWSTFGLSMLRFIGVCSLHLVVPYPAYTRIS